MRFHRWLLAVMVAVGVASIGALATTSSGTSSPIVITVKSQNASTITLAWTPPSGGEGYAFSLDGKRVSSTFDPSRSTVTFAKPAGTHTYGVHSFAGFADGSAVYPNPNPPPPPPPPPPGASLYVAPSGSDGNPCSATAPCATMNAAYQKAKAADVVAVAPGSYPGQVIGSRADLRNLSPGCTPATPGQCVHFVGAGVVINGSLEIHGSDVWVDGGPSSTSPGFNVTGYIDTEADSNTVFPDHVVVQGTHSSSFGIFNASTVTFRQMDVGPATITTGCVIAQGPGIEDKIGWAGGNTVVPTNVTVDGLFIHDQNGDAGRKVSDCHFGGLFLVTANGLTIEHTVFQANVVYNVQIQNFGGAPAPTGVLFDHDAFSCPADWLYNPRGCDGQSSIQFDGTFPTVTISNTAFAEGGNAGWGCYVPPCDFSKNVFGPGNLFGPPSLTAPPIPPG